MCLCRLREFAQILKMKPINKPRDSSRNGEMSAGTVETISQFCLFSCSLFDMVLNMALVLRKIMALKSPLQFQLVLMNLCLKDFFPSESPPQRQERSVCVCLCVRIWNISVADWILVHL